MQTIEHSGIFLSHFSDEQTSCVPQAKEHFLTLVESGELAFEIGKKKFFVRAGECVFLRRNHKMIFHKKPYKSMPYKGISIEINRQNLRDFFNKIPKNALPKNLKRKEINLLKLDFSPELQSFFAEISPYFEKQPTAEFCKGKIHQAIAFLLKENENFYPTLFDFSQSWKIDLIDFMDKHFADDLSMEEFAKFTGRSLATFKRDFAKVSALTPEKWLIQRRLQQAYELIFNKKQKAKEVYLEVGFKDISHFYKCFKKQYDVLPNG